MGKPHPVPKLYVLMEDRNAEVLTASITWLLMSRSHSEMTAHTAGCLMFVIYQDTDKAKPATLRNGTNPWFWTYDWKLCSAWSSHLFGWGGAFLKDAPSLFHTSFPGTPICATGTPHHILPEFSLVSSSRAALTRTQGALKSHGSQSLRTLTWCSAHNDPQLTAQRSTDC